MKEKRLFFSMAAFVLVTVAVIASMALILLHEQRQMRQVESGTERLWQMHDSIHAVHRHIMGLALRGEAAAGWNDSERVDYRDRRLLTDSLLAMLARENDAYVPAGEIDTLRRLLAEKETLLTAVMEIRRQREELNRRLAEELPDAVRQATSVRQVTVRKKGIAGLLGGKKTVQVAPKADKLHALNERVAVLHEEQTADMEARSDSLTDKNEELNLRLVSLVSRMDSVAEAAFMRRGKELDAIRKRSFRTLAVISGVAIILLAVSFGIIRRDIRRRARKKEEKERLIAHLQDTTRKNEELMRARRNIMQTVAHELRTPLAAIGGNAELIRNGCAEDDTSRRAETILRSSGQMSGMIDSLLNYFRIDSGKETVCRKVFPLRSIAETLEAEFAPQTDAKGLYLAVMNRADEVVEGDKGLVLRIGANLMSNAVKFTDQGMIRLETDYRDGVFTLSVEDTGSGIGKNGMERIFTPFERLSNAATQDGFGLGLAIVDNLVRMMEGEISVESECGRGSRFTVSLPMERAVADDEGHIRHEHLAGYSVIAIEDNDVLLGMMRDMFLSNGIRCDICHTAGELTEKMRMRDYDLVITDLKMPEMNGYEILELLRLSDIGNSRTVPVAVVTASGSVTEEELLGAGFTACLFKPFSVEDLLTMAEGAAAKVPPRGDSPILTPDFSPLLGYGDKGSTLDRIIAETEADMESFEDYARTGDTSAMSSLAHKMRSSWMLMGTEGVLKAFHKTLRGDDYSEGELAGAVERVLEQGRAIVRAAREQKGGEA